MATIGHPLADVTNLLNPYTTANSSALNSGRVNENFKIGALDGLPTKEQNLEWYTEVAGWNPQPEIGWGDAFGIYKGTIIMQGIAARYAMRVASSAKAQEYAVQMKPYAEFGWQMIEHLVEQLKTKKQKASL
jgi:aminoglycoside phosphotransferase (APT) family kinase protein